MLDISLKDLDSFHGTFYWYNVNGVNVTDGVKYVMDNGYDWVVKNAATAVRKNINVKGEEFLTIELKLLGNGKADVVYSDGNGNVLLEEDYEVTNAVKEFKLCYVRADNVMCLPMEY